MNRQSTEAVGVHMRMATEGDLPAILVLLADPDMDGDHVVDIARGREIFRRMQTYPGYQVHVAEHAASIVGSFAMLMMPNLGHGGASIAIVDGVVVAAAHRDRGWGRQMIAYALRIARDNGCYKLMLSSNLRRERAHAFYEQLGFERHGYSFRVDL